MKNTKKKWKIQLMYSFYLPCIIFVLFKHNFVFLNGINISEKPLVMTVLLLSSILVEL